MLDIGNTTFYEKINIVKLKYILNNKDKYKDIVEAEEKAMRRSNRTNTDTKCTVWSIIKKVIKNTTPIPNSEYGYINVNYKKGSKSNNIGRWYADSAIGLAPMCSCIRHTICDNIWIDIDQVNSHPTITKTFMTKNGFISPLLNKCFEDRESFLNTIAEEEACSRDEAKTAVISVINGGKFKTPTLMQLADELKPCINKVIKLPEYKEIYDHCKRVYGDNYNLSGKTFSRILQIVENDLLECYIDYCQNHDLVPEYKNKPQICLIFDGFQLINNDKINQELLDDMRKVAFEKTGYDIPLKIKPFDNKLDIPSDYNEVDEDDEDEEVEDIPDDIMSYQDFKKDFELTHVKISHPPSVYTIDNDKDEIQNMKNARDTYAQLTCYITKTVLKNKKKYDVKECKPFIHQWLIDKNIRYYKRICWKPPPLINDDCEFNTWKPFTISYITLEKSSRKYYQEFLTFCENLFESKEVMNYVLSRYAFRLQNPGLRTNVCVVYFGVEGAGKSTFIDTIYKIFDKYAIQIDKAKKLYDSHSSYEKEKCFICVNEAGGTDNFENCEVLKTRITEDKLYINPKGIQAYEIDNLCDYDMTTNNINVIKITDHSTRRWFQHECTGYYLGNVEFFNNYRKNILGNTNALRQIYDGLMAYDWKDIIKSGNFQDANFKPVTNITKQVKECNRDKIVWFFKELTRELEEEEDDGNEIKLTNKALFFKWNEWCVENKIEYRINNIQFGLKVKMLCDDVKRIVNYDFCDKHAHYFIFYKNVFREYIDILDR